MAKKALAKPHIRRNHKDSLFHVLFGTEKYKGYALELYNAINGTAYAPEDLEITTIEDVIYMGVKNDASVIVDAEMSLWEHQSTLNPNMPLRGLLYFARLYEGYISRHELNIFSEDKLPLPTPRYYVFYNGREDVEEVSRLRLSDLFSGNGDVEVTATMLNINEGHNQELLEKCRPLKDYARLISLIRAYSETMVMQEAVDRAVEQSIEEGILEDFLQSHKAEVKGMLLTEYNERKTLQMLQKEWFAKGEERGLAKGEADSLKKLARNIRKRNPELSEAEALEQAKAWLRE